MLHPHQLSSHAVLLLCRCVIVDKLHVLYRLPTASGVSISQPQQQPAALQDSDLYVEVERLDSYTHILPELTRMFNAGVKEPDMAQFLIALILTMVRFRASILTTPVPSGMWCVGDCCLLGKPCPRFLAICPGSP